jgi:putative addiction module component (TIGR02574 family)
MSLQLPDLDIDHLTIEQRLDLIALLWDSIPNPIDNLPVPEWHERELDRRLANADADPTSAIPWEQVKAQLRDET